VVLEPGVQLVPRHGDAVGHLPGALALDRVQARADVQPHDLVCLVTFSPSLSHVPEPRTLPGDQAAYLELHRLPTAVRMAVVTLEELGLSPVVVIESLQLTDLQGQLQTRGYVRACFAPSWLYVETGPQGGDPEVEVIPVHRVRHAAGLRPD
jgi:hypothetical protein